MKDHPTRSGGTPLVVSRCHTAFTLIELLIVVAIIAVLATLTIPAVGKAMAKANFAADINRLRQIGTAMSQYAGEFNSLPYSSGKIPGTESSPGAGDRWTFLEAVDRFMPPDKSFNPASIYNWMRRPIWFSPSAKAYPGFSPPSGASDIKTPVAFGYNPNVDNIANWGGSLAKIPKRSGIVIMAEANDPQGHRLDPSVAAETRSNVRTAYRTSQPNKQGLYLFSDFHVEALSGDRGYAYYSTNPSEPNIWKWW